MAKTNMPVATIGGGLEGLDEYGVVGGKVDEERRKTLKEIRER